MEQRSIEWFNARQGSVTGTRLQRAVGSPKVQETFSYELVSERMTEAQISTFDTEAMARGRDMEPFAIEAVEKESKLKFDTCGMMKSEFQEWFAISPDAVARNSKGIIVGGVETKAPDSKKHVEYLLKDEVPKEYFYQVLAPFVVSYDIDFWIFASYDDRNYNRPLFAKMVLRKDIEKQIEATRIKLKAFLDNVSEMHQGLIF